MLGLNMDVELEADGLDGDSRKLVSDRSGTSPASHCCSGFGELLNRDRTGGLCAFCCSEVVLMGGVTKTGSIVSVLLLSSSRLLNDVSSVGREMSSKDDRFGGLKEHFVLATAVDAAIVSYALVTVMRDVVAMVMGVDRGVLGIAERPAALRASCVIVPRCDAGMRSNVWSPSGDNDISTKLDELDVGEVVTVGDPKIT